MTSRVGVAVLLSCMIAAASSAQAKRVFGKFSGTSTQTQNDINGDGVLGSATLSHGNGTLGDNSGSGVSELLPWDGSSMCSTSEPIFRLLYAAQESVIRIENGDLWYESVTDGFVCLDLRDNTFDFESHATITGGTGVFDGATGSNTAIGTGKVLVRDPAGNPILASFSGTSKGEIFLRR